MLPGMTASGHRTDIDVGEGKQAATGQEQSLNGNLQFFTGSLN